LDPPPAAPLAGKCPAGAEEDEVAGAEEDEVAGAEEDGVEAEDDAEHAAETPTTAHSTAAVAIRPFLFDSSRPILDRRAGSAVPASADSGDGEGRLSCGLVGS
jgi:hypothetical protein